MSIEMQIDLIGTDVQFKMEQLDASVKARVQQRLEEIAESIKETAQNLAPVRTGYLRSTIFTETQAEWLVKVGAKAPYSAYVENGTRFTAAHYFLSNAIEEHRPQFADLVSQAVDEGIREASH